MKRLEPGPGHLRRDVGSGHARAAPADRRDRRRRHPARPRALRLPVRASQLRRERGHRGRLRRRARRRNARDDARPRVRSGQELGREERSLPALEPDRPHPERHPDRRRRQEGPLDDRRRRRRPRRLYTEPPALQAVSPPHHAQRTQWTQRPDRIRFGFWCPSVRVLAARRVGGAVSPRRRVYESVGIRAQGMGGAFVAVADDATASWWNPAGLAGGAYFQLASWRSGPAASPTPTATPGGAPCRPGRDASAGSRSAYPALG